MLQLAAPPERPRPALLASIGLHALAASAFGFGPMLALPDAPGWRGAVWAVTQPVLSVPRDATPVDLRERPAPRREGGDRGNGGLPAAPRGATADVAPSPALAPRLVPDELPPASDAEPDEPGFPGGLEDGAGVAPGTGGDGAPGDDGPIDARDGALPEGVVLPVPLETPAPRYSDTARIARATGPVVLTATIAADGRVVDVVVEASPSPLLTRLALEAVSRWTYRPARVGTRPVAVLLRVTLTFRLE